jgi:F0F1-type ATP synthase membrane subunit c/vacuolar-type H+-ATPase subunit K
MNRRSFGAWLAIGIGVGTALGVAFKNIPIGVACGVAFGSLIGALARRAQPPTP